VNVISWSGHESHFTFPKPTGEKRAAVAVGNIHYRQHPINRATIRTGGALAPGPSRPCGERIIGIVLGGGGTNGLRIVKKRYGTAFVLHPEDTTVSFMRRVAIARKIVRFAGLFCPATGLFRLIFTTGLPLRRCPDADEHRACNGNPATLAGVE
jgi:hypothetical protein